MPYLDRISITPSICLGQPTIRGMRITVSAILRALASSGSKDEVLRAYPELEMEDINQAIHYAAWLASDQF
jgi:uncharacterized protein (DUF433 family)